MLLRLGAAALALAACHEGQAPADMALADLTVAPPDLTVRDLTRFDESLVTLSYNTCTNSLFTNHGSVITVVRFTPPGWPFFVSVVEFNGYYEAVSGGSTQIPPHTVRIWAGPHAEPAANPTPLVTAQTVIKDVPGVPGTIILNGSVAVDTPLPSIPIITAGQDLFVAIDNANNITACQEGSPAGNESYSYALTAPYQWQAQDTSSFTLGLRVQGYAQNSLTCPSDKPTPCPSADAPTYCTAASCN